jgi:hypothetical protein
MRIGVRLMDEWCWKRIQFGAYPGGSQRDVVDGRCLLSWLTNSISALVQCTWAQMGWGMAGGGGGLRNLSQWVQLYTWSPNKLWSSNSIFNLCAYWEGGWADGSSPPRCIHGAQINFGALTPYLTYMCLLRGGGEKMVLAPLAVWSPNKIWSSNSIFNLCTYWGGEVSRWF